MGIVFVWDIDNSYTKLFTINTKYNDIIYSCLLVFTGDGSVNENKSISNSNGYIITSTFDISKENQNSATKVYSIENGDFINYIKNTNTNSVFYLLSWINKKDKKNYIIQFCYMKILITNLLDDDDVYAELIQEQKLSYYSGFIYEQKQEDKVYLYSSSKNGFINIWDLDNKILVNNININGSILCHIIQWDEKYAIVANYNGKSFKVINLETLSAENDIGDSHTKEVKSIKKIRHPLLGDSLLTAGNDNTIKLWSI
jgi:WD40 repeat protein